MFIIFSVFYILIAAAMIVLILMQRGEGADAGASFGGGSSGTVLGARGSANFMSRATGVLAGLFFLLSLGMAIYLAHSGAPTPSKNLGVMAGVGTTSSQSAGKKASAAPVKQQPATAVPAAAQPAASASSQAATAKSTGATESAVPTATVPAKTEASSKAGKNSTKQEQGSSGSGKK